MPKFFIIKEVEAKNIKDAFKREKESSIISISEIKKMERQPQELPPAMGFMIY